MSRDMRPGLRVTTAAAVRSCGLVEKQVRGLMDGFTLVGSILSNYGVFWDLVFNLAWYLGSPCVAPCILVDVGTHRLHMSVTVMPCSLARLLICALCYSLGYKLALFSRLFPRLCSC